jgi:hypothetical protein
MTHHVVSACEFDQYRCHRLSDFAGTYMVNVLLTIFELHQICGAHAQVIDPMRLRIGWSRDRSRYGMIDFIMAPRANHWSVWVDQLMMGYMQPLSKNVSSFQDSRDSLQPRLNISASPAQPLANAHSFRPLIRAPAFSKGNHSSLMACEEKQRESNNSIKTWRSAFQFPGAVSLLLPLHHISSTFSWMPPFTRRFPWVPLESS